MIRSDGSPERDFIHVDDAIAAYLAIAGALDNGAVGEAFNAGGERPHSVREVVELITDAAGGTVEPDFQGTGNPDGEIDRQFVDSTKLRELTGWRPQVAARATAAPALSSGIGTTPRLDLSRLIRHVRTLHGYGERHEDDCRSLPGGAGTLVGAQFLRRGASAEQGAGEKSRIGSGALQRGADPGGADGARLARSRGGSCRETARRG